MVLRRCKRAALIGLLCLTAVTVTACGGGTSSGAGAGNSTSGTGNTSNGGNTTGNHAAGTGSNSKNGGTTKDSSAQAASLFKKNCMVCHGANLGGGVGPNLQKIGASWSKAKITTQITNGGGGMPSFKGKLNDSQIRVLADWLSSKK